jgi:hypothetical protein
MLAYVFWHWPKSDVAVEHYVLKLGAFHESLAMNAPAGFSHSLVFELRKPRWLQASSIAFEDWYLVEDSAALDKLNFVAISGNNELPHNQVAFDAAGGTAGLYRLRLGDLQSLGRSPQVTWFSKSPGASYADLFSKLNALCSSAGVGLWCRQMTLGPTTEFCLRSESEISWPEGVATEVDTMIVKTVWSS